MTQGAKINDLLLGKCTISIWARYSEMTLGQYSFWKNSFDIGKIH